MGHVTPTARRQRGKTLTPEEKQRRGQAIAQERMRRAEEQRQARRQQQPAPVAIPVAFALDAAIEALAIPAQRAEEPPAPASPRWAVVLTIPVEDISSEALDAILDPLDAPCVTPLGMTIALERRG